MALAPLVQRYCSWLVVASWCNKRYCDAFRQEDLRAGGRYLEVEQRGLDMVDGPPDSATQCETIGAAGAGPGRHCVFPFEHDGTVYNACTAAGDTRFWCPVKFEAGEGLVSDWGYCSDSCPKTTPRFNCSAGYDENTDWTEAWSDEQQQWCCHNEKRGCQKEFKVVAENFSIWLSLPDRAADLNKARATAALKDMPQFRQYWQSLVAAINRNRKSSTETRPVCTGDGFGCLDGLCDCGLLQVCVDKGATRVLNELSRGSEQDALEHGKAMLMGRCHSPRWFSFLCWLMVYPIALALVLLPLLAIKWQLNDWALKHERIRAIQEATATARQQRGNR